MASKSTVPGMYDDLFRDLRDLPLDIQKMFPANALKHVQVHCDRKSIPCIYLTNGLGMVQIEVSL